MANARRGFNRERHTSLKLAITGLALGGFSLAWAGFPASHASVEPELQPGAGSRSAVLQFATPTPGRTARSSTPRDLDLRPATPTPPAGVGAAPTPAAPRSVTNTRPRRTRAS